MKIKLIKMLCAAVGALALAASSNAALFFANPLSYDTPGLVGTIEGLLDNVSGQSMNETEYNAVLKLIGMGANEMDPNNASYIYKTGSTDYNDAPVNTVLFKDDSGGVAVSSGWQYVLAKYDGPNAGYVLFYLGGQSAYLPTLPYDIWGNSNSTGYALSHYTVFGETSTTHIPPVPEPATVLAGVLLLLPFGASTIKILRRKTAA